MAPVLVTGAAGFIGHALSLALLRRGREVVGLDNLNAYYDPALKRARLAQLTAHSKFTFAEMDLASPDALEPLFDAYRFGSVFNMAAQAGVRYSIENPRAYLHSNLDGFLTVLEACRHHGVGHLVYASSSSVYGAGTRMPFSVHRSVDHPLSLYAATKKSNELMAHCYSHLYGLPTTGLRFFTVYGPWGRPDMAIFLFTRAMLAGKAIDVFNHGAMRRDFTYIDDIVECVARLDDVVPTPDPAWDPAAPDPGSAAAPYRIYNIGNNAPVELSHVIDVLERCLGVTAIRNNLPMQPGDVPATYADIDDLTRVTGFRPSTSIEEGIARFIAWYRDYYGV